MAGVVRRARFHHYKAFLCDNFMIVTIVFIMRKGDLLLVENGGPCFLLQLNRRSVGVALGNISESRLVTTDSAGQVSAFFAIGQLHTVWLHQISL
jgi:hypothetical protein